MLTLNKVLESKMKVRFHDCDPFNHLSNSRYIDYILTARGDQLLDHYDFDMYALARKEGLGWVSAQTQISYVYPALLAEEVAIETRLIGFSEKSLLMEGLMWNRDKTMLKALLWAKLVHYDLRTKKSHQHSGELMKLFGDIHDPLADTGFEQRLQTLKQTKS